MTESNYLKNFIHTCAQSQPESEGQKFIGWEGVVAILVYQGLKILLPELKEWVKLGGTVIAMKRLEIRKSLEAYALEKELDFQAAEQAAQTIAENITEDTLADIIDALDAK